MPRRLFGLFALALMSAALVVPGAGADAPGEPRAPRELSTSSCNVVKLRDRGYVLFRRGVPCTWAKRWVRRLSASGGRKEPAGFTCSSGSKFRGGGYCERGSKHFGWHAGD